MKKNIIPFSPKNGTPGCMVGKEVEIDSISQLTTIRFFLADYGNPEAHYSCSVYRFSDKDSPDLLIYNHPEVKSKSPGDEWIELSLESKEIILTPGKYLIAIRWPVSPEEDGSNSITVGFEESDEDPISWMNWHGQWQKDTGPFKGNFMIVPGFEAKKNA